MIGWCLKFHVDSRKIPRVRRLLQRGAKVERGQFATGPDVFGAGVMIEWKHGNHCTVSVYAGSKDYARSLVPGLVTLLGNVIMKFDWRRHHAPTANFGHRVHACFCVGTLDPLFVDGRWCKGGIPSPWRLGKIQTIEDCHRALVDRYSVFYTGSRRRKRGCVYEPPPRTKGRYSDVYVDAIFGRDPDGYTPSGHACSSSTS